METADFVLIEPKSSYLSPEDLIANRNKQIEPPGGGLKRIQNHESPEELAELRSAHAVLRAQLSVARIERLGGRALARWREDQQVAEVLKKDGKFENFGRCEQGKLVLEYYEALFLLELGRLQLEFAGKAASIEQAYVLLLGEGKSEKYTHYLVYSALSRAGYIVVGHRDARAAPDPDPTPTPTPAPVTSSDCIWAWLKEKVGHQPLPAQVKASAHFALTAKRLDDLMQVIVSPRAQESPAEEETTDFHFDTRKRRAESELKGEQASKRGKHSVRGRSLVAHLKAESSYAKFEDVFQQFDIVKLDSQAYSEDDQLPPRLSMQITFDLHLHNEGFRKRDPKTPNFNVVILPPQVPFPTHRDIFHIGSQDQSNTAPLLVVSVSDSKQMQAFLYFIS